MNVISHTSRPKKQHLGRDTTKVILQWDKEREQQTKLLSEMHDTMKDSKKQSAEYLMTMQLKTYYKMCKHHGNDEGCNAAMVYFLLPWYKLLEMTMVKMKNSKYFLNVNQITLLLFLLLDICSFRS